MRHASLVAVALGLTVGTAIGNGDPVVASARFASDGITTPAAGASIAGIAGIAGIARAVRASAGTKTVSLAGYLVDVPSSWPVFRLDRDPARCVRFDQHAVYLGHPGADQQCPAHLVGRTEALLVDVLGSGPGLAHGVVYQRGYSGYQRGRAFGMAGEAVVREPIARQVQVMPADPAGPGVSFTATYGADSPTAERIIQSVRVAPRPGPAEPRATASSDRRVLPWRPAATPLPLLTPPLTRFHVGPPGVWSAAGLPSSRPRPPPIGSPVAHRPSQAPPRRSLSAATRPVTFPSVTQVASARRARQANAAKQVGFDTCAAPSLVAMRAWRPTFGTVNIYIGGASRACGDGNLSAHWVRVVRAMGWSLIPTYVGVQAPCNPFAAKIDAKHAAGQGHAAADDAIAQANRLGMGRHAPIYYDIEAYNSGNRKCRSTVLTLLDAWTRELHARRHISGVYSSAASGIEDLGYAQWIAGHAIAKPNSVWFAHWDGKQSVWGDPYLLDTWWRNQRIKQYRGDHREKHNGVTLEIDTDQVNGAVY